MTFEQARLVRETFQRIADVAPEAVGRLFYHHLFDIAPQVRSLFSRTPLPEQSVKFMALLTYVVSRLNEIDSIVQDVTALAQRHQRYGITEKHYVYVGQSLLRTLEQTLTVDWTPEVQEAWTACYALLADTMINAPRLPISTLRPTEPYPISYAPGY
ncbi:globin family protein [Spirosoma flavus]